MRRLALTLLLLCPAPAEAARVGFERTIHDSTQFVLRGDPGEASDLVISRDGRSWLFADARSAVRAGDGCHQVDERTVRCDDPGVPLLLLGDGDDRARVAAGRPNPVRVFGEQGDDVLAGGDGADELVPGPGADLAVGGSGADRIEAHEGAADAPDVLEAETVSYLGRAAPLHADLAEGTAGADRVAGVVELVGGSGSDVLRGSGRAERLNGGLPGHTAGDTLIGRGGDDALHGSHGTDVLLGGSGDDRLLGMQGPDRYDGGAGDDHLEFPLQSRTSPGFLRCGAGRDLLTVPVRIAQPSDCEGRDLDDVLVWLRPSRVTVERAYPGGGSWCRVDVELRRERSVRAIAFRRLRHGRPQSASAGTRGVHRVVLRRSSRCGERERARSWSLRRQGGRAGAPRESASS